ncbi:hypothetical protein A2635_05045 [Candidatus Peribacteria bacterium RIFCSPHIGHO2_01_FULL_51_9]|nr:MAG: hypothetical protein A2635_05045 [Candidatus Peribacteria bacterium RIFCSPHIGHO2_01_FULL_51_9]
MATLDPRIFRSYDIRGKAHEQVSAQACLLIGKAFGSTLREMYKKQHPTVVVGRDARTHGPELEQALIEGLKTTGCHVLTIDQTPSPVNYFTICTQKCDGGVQITASHNPKEDNGLKLQIRDAQAYSGNDLQKLLKRIEREEFLTGKGSIKHFDACTPYKKYLSKMFQNMGKNLHVAIDGGNGVAGPLYVEVLKSIGCTVTEIFTEPDGTFPNHAADPSKWDTLRDLQKAVKKTRADIGLAFDGDGDRIGIVDEKGIIRTADEILLLLAKDHLSRNPGKPVVFTVSNSSSLETEIQTWGGIPVMCTVGHSFVEHTMRQHGALLGGEQSGHFFFGEDYFGFDDALMASLRTLSILQKRGLPFSALFEEFPKVYQTPEYRPTCRDEDKARIVEEIKQHFLDKKYPMNPLDGARIDFGEGAWAGIRKSNTAPRLSVCMEARSPEKLKEVEREVMGVLKMYSEISW